jgi:hypothetical protein
MRRPWSFALVTLLAGCWGRGFEYGGGTGGTDDTSAPVLSECGADLDLEAGINIRGTVVDLQTKSLLVAPTTGTGPALCVAAIDPTPAVVNGDPEYLITSTLCDDGTFVLAGLEEVPTIGIMIGVYDCPVTTTAPAANVVMRTVTGVSSEAFDGFGPGDTLEGVTAWSVSMPYLATLQADLGEGAVDLAASGFLSGFVLDSAGAPVSGAVVTCGSCGDTPTFYRDASPDDGLWGDGTNFNTATIAEADALFLIPAARITTYTCEDGGAHTWEGTLFGSLPGYGVFIQFDAS